MYIFGCEEPNQIYNQNMGNSAGLLLGTGCQVVERSLGLNFS